MPVAVPLASFGERVRDLRSLDSAALQEDRASQEDRVSPGAAEDQASQANRSHGPTPSGRTGHLMLFELERMSEQNLMKALMIGLALTSGVLS